MASSSKVFATIVDDDAAAYETQHVHEVYDQIASHFSTTRYKPWPIIAQFLSDLPTGWVGLDSGTGNGKYLPLPADRPGSIWTIGLDRSRNLLDAARIAGGPDTLREVVWGDVLGRGWRVGAFDYAISVATIHHLATPQRRQLAIQRLLESVSPHHGRLLVYVWAIEQDDLSKRDIPTSKLLTTPVEAKGQDVMVPWVLTQQTPREKEQRRRNKGQSASEQEIELPLLDPLPQDPKTFNRYYHMFAKGELRELVESAARTMDLRVGAMPNGGHEISGVEIVQSGWERSNYYVEVRRWRI
ncbi:S-adenosyl-L-methionine-dependent methyltransferase [Amylostereum chailletii]|nr:S-adenosyl-L-methionine-dependent methyltransferase [Amylostereum chailletii]